VGGRRPRMESAPGAVQRTVDPLAEVGAEGLSSVRGRAGRVAGEGGEDLVEVLANLVDGFVVFDREWRYTYVNAAAARMSSRTPEELLGRVLWEVFPDMVRMPLYKHFRRAVEEKVAVQFEQYATCKLWFECRCQPAGEGLAVYFTDITERKRAERELREARGTLEEEMKAAERLRSLSAQVVDSGDGEAVYRQMLETAMAIMGADFASIQSLEEGTNAQSRRLKLVAWKNFDPTSARFWHWVTAGSGTACGEALLRGERIIIADVERSALVAGTPDLAEFRRSGIRSVQSTPLVSRSGRFLGMISTHWREPHEPCERKLNALDRLARQIADLIDRQEHEEALHESEERFRTLADGTPLVIWITDEAGRNRFVNRAYCEFFGVKPSQAQDFRWQPLVHPEDRGEYIEECQRALRERRTFRAQARVRRHDGMWRWIDSYGEPRFSPSGEFLGMAGSSPDVTERKEFQAELERLVAERTARLQEAVGELEHFSYTITHDMRAPLRGMRGFAEVASKLCGNSAPKEVKEALARIETSAQRMDALITDALSYSCSVRKELPLRNVDVGALLRGMLESYPELRPSRAQIEVVSGLPVVVGNQAGLTQVFSNLLDNALKFVKHGERPEIRIWSEEREGWARICVEDKGIGISREMLPRVFDMFSRGNVGYVGTGIGLALVRKVTQRMGGRVGAESEERRGSRFWIELKLGEARPEARKVEVAPAETKGGAVLYVEDEESDATFMRIAFAKKGMEPALRVVGSGRAAIEYFSGVGRYADRREYPMPSVVLLDLNLPQMTGFEVLKWMKNQPQCAWTPVVVFSSSTLEHDQSKALELGANEFVVKPSSGMKFGEVVERLRERWLGETQGG
jgi:PAS domain S-box-containing protein